MSVVVISMGCKGTLLLRKDVRERKRRAFRYCNPNTPFDYASNCEIVWESIRKSEEELLRVQEKESLSQGHVDKLR